MKKLLSLILCAVMLLGLVACGGTTASEATNPPCCEQRSRFPEG